MDEVSISDEFIVIATVFDQEEEELLIVLGGNRFILEVAQVLDCLIYDLLLRQFLHKKL